MPALGIGNAPEVVDVIAIAVATMATVKLCFDELRISLFLLEAPPPNSISVFRGSSNGIKDGFLYANLAVKISVRQFRQPFRSPHRDGILGDGVGGGEARDGG